MGILIVALTLIAIGLVMLGLGTFVLDAWDQYRAQYQQRRGDDQPSPSAGGERLKERGH